ncbi:acyl-ACP thioesterase [Streptococcus pneumoniae]|uniref:Acyl-ACP thioesterase n=1 Tax=Streptococcus pneumoniae TaxID=1313 RepID=A0A4J1NMF9_STREE|nr:acyl-ACP thioesterase [Streptococcus pneumoniae]VLX05263.1 acyl-ACP thioesterase [Streptococcus pneumoniae]VMD33732.1 acyl-ACP thioesterase [Streptococcus pneumoniae]VMH08850.1 acyl-ACP thioesterase [Streptococcus pneumoniae]VMI55091.1 acyl-ACP thioesterase [Streptococcus pneumoniae]
MGLTYQMKMKIPFDMADMNGHRKSRSARITMFVFTTWI